jgi:hypothetical protein
MSECGPSVLFPETSSHSTRKNGKKLPCREQLFQNFFPDRSRQRKRDRRSFMSCGGPKILQIKQKKPAYRNQSLLNGKSAK